MFLLNQEQNGQAFELSFAIINCAEIFVSFLTHSSVIWLY
ncbi:MAG: hypothetical protein ACJA01_004554 [Saprospiraceae bacterium]